MTEEQYPTVWAYEQACAALARCKQENERLQQNASAEAEARWKTRNHELVAEVKKHKHQVGVVSTHLKDRERRLRIAETEAKQLRDGLRSIADANSGIWGKMARETLDATL